MFVSVRRSALSAVVVFFWVGAAFAATADDWESGKQAFAARDFPAALRYFEMARDAGLQGPAVHYNIGVTQFRLKRYADAAKTFRYIADTYPKLRGLAEYNLGLVSLEQSSRRDAEAHFERAYELSLNDRKLHVLAARRLNELNPDRQFVSRWRGSVGARLGHDGNAALLDQAGLPAGTTTDSPVVDAFGSFSGPWTDEGGIGVEGNAYVVKYSSAGEFDQTVLRGGAYYEWCPERWRLQAGVRAGTGTIGGDAFDRTVGARVRAVRYLGTGAAIDFQYSYDDVSEADSRYAGIAGSRQEYDLRYLWYRDDHRVVLRYRHETNDRSDPGVSPARNRFGIAYRYQPDRGIGFETEVDLRNSNYGDLVESREEKLRQVRLAMTYMFRNNWLASVEFFDASNDSTNAVYSYDRIQVLFGASKFF